MGHKENLTNEGLKGLFKSNFELANYAIRLGRYYVKSSHEVVIDDLLDEVRRNPNLQYVKDLENLDIEEKNAPAV